MELLRLSTVSLPTGTESGAYPAICYHQPRQLLPTFAGNRSFGISMNGTTVLDDFNIARDYGYARAVIKKFVVTVKDGKGLSVDFHKKEGEPILNAIRIYRNY